MITLYAVGRVHPGMIGEARGLRAQWALEETGLPYCVHALNYIAGELDVPAYSRLSCFHQVPVIDDDGFIVGESATPISSSRIRGCRPITRGPWRALRGSAR